MPETGESPYHLTLDLSVLDHLADGLYSSVAAVLTEAVANSWDADAKDVRIRINLPGDSILISDDGIGMDIAEINERYLRVGYRKRTDMVLTPGGRSVMGRKGIGKLSLFSIADEIRVETRMDGSETRALVIDIPEMKAQIAENRNSEYRPIPVPVEHSELLEKHGTVLTLRRLKTRRLRDANAESLRRKIARRFSVIGSDGFRVSVNEIAVEPSDRDDLKFSQYLWVFDGTRVEKRVAKDLLQSFGLENRAAGWKDGWNIRGWIGTVDRPKQLATREGNLNSVVVLSRGRLVDEDVLPRVTDAEIYTKYVTGQIEADFLDSADEDIVTSDRQRLREDDERVTALLAFVRARMREIANRWTELRNADKTDDLRARYPGIDSWLNRLERGWRKKAERLLARLATMEIDEQDRPDQARRELIRHAIYGFERLRLRGDAEELEVALGRGIEDLLRLFADRDALEAAHYRDIVANRLEMIADFEQLVDKDEQEKILQRHLFNHLWLLDPAWDRATGDDAMEERLRLLDPFRDDADTKELYGRIDIRYRTVAGKRMIVELKRRSVRPTAGTLLDQVTKYVQAFRVLDGPDAQIEAVIVVGHSVPGAELPATESVAGAGSPPVGVGRVRDAGRAQGR